MRRGAHEVSKLAFVILSSFYAGLFSMQGNAEQVFVKNNGVVSSTASLKEITRIAFENDEVESIYALSGEMTHEVKANNLFIKLKSEKPINFFVLTKNSNVYKVILTPKDITAKQLIIRKRVTKEQEGRRIKNSDSALNFQYSEENLLRQNIAAIIKVVLANETKAGFKVDIDEDNLGKFGPFQLNQKSVWTAVHTTAQTDSRSLIAKKILVTNTEDRRIQLNRKDFRRIKLKKFVTKEFCPLAVYLERTSLGPFESTYLILIAKDEQA